MNRREFTPAGVTLGVNPRGPVDRSVPVLRVAGADGRPRAVLFSYACHNTTLTGDNHRLSGDYAGFAQAEIERRVPGVQAMFMAGTGADANPYPRGTLPDAQRHGEDLGEEVARVLTSTLQEVSGPLRVAFDEADLPLQQPTRTELERMAKDGSGTHRATARQMLARLDRGESLLADYAAPLGVWQFGSSLTLVALSGEVVVDYLYALERALGPLQLWVVAYTNDYFGYLPSPRVLEEGGYETRGLFSGDGWFSPEASAALVDSARGLAARVGRALPASSNGAGAGGSSVARLRSIGADATAGTAKAVVVEDGALVHTAAFQPVDADGRVQGAGDADAQAAYVLENLKVALAAAGASAGRLVRLHVYVADASVVPAVDRALTNLRSQGASPPAVTIVESRMPRAGVLVAMDAVAVTTRATRAGAPERLAVSGLAPVPGGGAHVAVQPEGPFAIVSGRAAPGELETAVRGTMEQLRADLQSIGLGFEHAVHVKTFLSDMTRATDVQQIVASVFQGTAPPQVVTEWRDASLPVEIELVAAAPGAVSGGERLSLVEPISSRFSRVARVFAGQPVFVSGLVGTSTDPATQVREIFKEMSRLLEQAGSDMRHLVKATYYVSDKTADAEINTIRPTIFDAARPPAASKISVQGTGRSGKGAVIDMIAVTTDR
jgi:enamine deaminase RidA (YjgF/YER057c/UK114 family)